jgi:hypothetical protein
MRMPGYPGLTVGWREQANREQAIIAAIFLSVAGEYFGKLVVLNTGGRLSGDGGAELFSSLECY